MLAEVMAAVWALRQGFSSAITAEDMTALSPAGGEQSTGTIGAHCT